jgi:predicted nucleotidyltransferase
VSGGVPIESQILAELDRIETEEQVHVLYACESGSRAWGFASQDSDFDVRFIYVRPTREYLTIQNKRDVIERPIDGDLDISGWDLPKALELFRKSNPPLLEWLQSPIIYCETGSCAARMRELMGWYHAPIACLHHYLHMAEGNNRQYLQGDEVWVKKYLYVLRPVLACLWIERDLGVVPMEFRVLVDRLIENPALRTAIDSLLDRKRAGMELDRGPRIPEISEFVSAEIARLAAAHATPPHTRDPEPLDRLFVEMLVETYGDRIAGNPSE